MSRHATTVHSIRRPERPTAPMLHWSTCSCGWETRQTYTRAAAQQDAELHRRRHRPRWLRALATIGREAAPVLLMLCAFVALLAVVVAGLAAVTKVSCERRAEAIERPAVWGFWEGCLIETDQGELVPYDRWLNIEGALR